MWITSELEKKLNHKRRQNMRLPGSSGRHTLQMSESALFAAVKEHGPEIASTRAGWDELHEQARFNELVSVQSAPGFRNRHGRVTWHKSY